MKEAKELKTLKEEIKQRIKDFFENYEVEREFDGLGLVELIVLDKYFKMDDNAHTHRASKIGSLYSLLYNGPTPVSIGTVMFQSTVRYKRFIDNSAKSDLGKELTTLNTSERLAAIKNTIADLKILDSTFINQNQ